MRFPCQPPKLPDSVRMPPRAPPFPHSSARIACLADVIFSHSSITLLLFDRNPLTILSILPSNNPHPTNPLYPFTPLTHFVSTLPPLGTDATDHRSIVLIITRSSRKLGNPLLCNQCLYRIERVNGLTAFQIPYDQLPSFESFEGERRTTQD